MRELAEVAAIAVGNLAWRLPSGEELFRDVGFRVGNGDRRPTTSTSSRPRRSRPACHDSTGP
jgi:hypothetical protein